MWSSLPTAESLTRPRLAVIVISAVAAASVGYYAYQSNFPTSQDLPVGAGLHRSNAIRRDRRSRRTDTISSSSSNVDADADADAEADANNDADAEEGDENANLHVPRHLTDAPTLVDEAVGEPWWDEPGLFPPSQRAGQNIVNLLFRVSEDNARRNGCVHRGCQCNSCGMVPIRGIRYRCANCADFDLCETCEAQGVHIKTHIFYKIKVPAPPFSPRQMQPVWYTGDPDTCPRSLPKRLIAKLTTQTGFERPELEAFWEQYTFMANTEWREDPDGMGVAMDRKTFERCLVPTGGSRHAAPNLIHDRMFHFYDSNHDDLIGFSEFLEGLSYRKRKDKLKKVFEGYDLDADGYVDRRDFLRMFRAYYVLYKQMHKDILDGLEDQLLSSTEAQQLINGRQPLSSLFGREGRVPPGEAGMRFEGKTYQPDGSVELEDGLHSAIADDRPDTAARGDILTSLFACSTDPRPLRRFVTGSDQDNQWRTVRRLTDSYRPERAYIIGLLNPPQSLSDLPDIFGDRDLQTEELGEEETEDNAGEDGWVREDHVTVDSDGVPSPPSPERCAQTTDSQRRAMAISYSRRRAPKMERKRRDMARRQLHDRWRRRQFYLDEEEGGSAPDDFAEEEDILANANTPDVDSKSAEPPLYRTRSRSSSKVRFADDADDFDVQSNPSTSSRSIPERWGGMEMPLPERDAGKEILYQVTQQAFNELLDSIFKPAEDLALDAAETKREREKYKDLLANVELQAPEPVSAKNPPDNHDGRQQGMAPETKSLEQLLSETGYTVVPDAPRNAVEIDARSDIAQDLSENLTAPADVAPEQPEQASETKIEVDESRDPTLPQFRPNSSSAGYEASSEASLFYPLTPLSTTNQGNDDRCAEDASEVEETEPTPAELQRWKRLDVAEAKAAERGGWGKLSYAEFEEIFKTREAQGNRLDYLGSWIDFCIP